MKEGKIEMERSENTNQAIVTRINKMVGQLKGIQKMAKQGDSYDQLLVQVSSIKSGAQSLANYILEDYLTSIISKNGKIKTKEEMKEIINLYKKFNQK